MTTTSQESVPGTGTPLPELHERARLLSGLVDAMDELAELIGPRGTPIYAIIQAAVPMARDLARDLDAGRV